MKKGIISVIIGLPISILAVFLLYCYFFANEGFSVLITRGTIDMVYRFGAPVTFPLLIIGLILAVQGLRSKVGKVLPHIGIIANLVGILIGIFLLIASFFKG